MENYRGPRNQNFPRSANAEGFKACVKNIPVDMTKESLQALFSGCGNVVSGKVLPPRDGRTTTIGFVGFASEDELATAVETMHGTTLEGTCVMVEKAKERNRGTFQQDNQYERNQDTSYHNEQTFSSRDAMGVSHAMPSQGYRSRETEQTLFSVNDPGRGGGPGHPYSRLLATAVANEPSFSNHQEVGVKRESAIFNPAGPGRGGGVVMPHQPPGNPGRGNMLMNSISRNLGETSDQSPYDRVQSYDDSGQQSNIYNGELPRWTPSTEQPHQDMPLTGRLPYSVTSSPPHSYTASENTDDSHYANHFARNRPMQESRREGGSTCYRCGEIGHFARECPALGGKGFDKSCYKCGDESHFARDCPVAAGAEDGSTNKGSPNRVGPVTYIPPELPDTMDELFQDMPHSGLNFDKYDTIPVHVTGRTPPPPINSFEQAGLLDQCSINIRRAQFTKPTPIQKYAIPIALEGRDLMACAQTGSGKTVAFLLPVLTQMIKQGHLSGGFLSGDVHAPAALCMAPTRELALQIYKEVRKFSDGTVVKAAVCYGGVSVQYQSSKLAQGCHFLVATPGRLEDFISRGRVSLASVRYLILDEADRMLDMGFEPAIRKLVEACGMPDKLNRQTLMFSATFPDQIQKLAADFLKENYLFVAVGRVGGSNLDICQSVIPASANEKQEKLFEILLNSGTDRILVFVELKRVADFLACLLSGNNFPTTSISGDRTQQEREAALQDFRSGRAPVLVATSVAARGLDIPDVKHVINFDLPQDIEEYVHRIGRTGRIGNKGRATSFFQHGKDERLARSLVKVLSEAFQEVPEWLEQVAEEAIGSSYGPAGGKFASRDRREREHSRPSAPRGTASVTRAMQQLSVQSQQNGDLPQFQPSASHYEEDGEDWD